MRYFTDPGKAYKMKNKNILVIMLIVTMLVMTLMAGCGGSETTDATEVETKATVQHTETKKTSENEASESESESKATTTAADSGKKAEIEKVAENKSTQSTTSDKKATQSSKPAAKPTQPATKATEAVKTCYITVDGYCSSKSVEIKSGDSVYDILKKSGANVSARNSGYGIYVEGINGRFEFDEGPTSGWIYTVNGSRPSTGCSNYEVKSGDKIVWTYVEEI